MSKPSNADRNGFEDMRRPAPATAARRITTDAEAIDAATALAARLSAGAARRDRERLLPWDEIEAYSASGLGAITVPKEFGGPELSFVTLVRVFEILCAADPSAGQIPQNHFGVLALLRDLGSPEQKQRFYADILKGERIGNAGPERGRNMISHVTTRITATAGGLRLTGRRFYSTGGVTVIDDWDGFGQRVTGSGSVRFERVRVEPEWVVPFKASFDRPTTIGPHAQIMHAAIDLGIGFGAFEETLRFVRERSRPWLDSGVEKASEDPLTLHQVGHVRLRLRAAEALVERAAGFVDAAQRAPDEDSVARASIAVAQARILTTKAGLLAAEKLFELSGTSATQSEDNLDRYWRNVRTHTLHDPVRWKYQAVGNFYLNGKRPPRHGAI